MSGAISSTSMATCAARRRLRHSALRFGTAHRFGTALFLCWLTARWRCAQIVIPGVLSEEECDRANAAIDRQIGSEAYPNIVPGATRGNTDGTESSILGFPDGDSLPFKEMLAHPTIAPYLNTLLGQGWRLDHAPLLLTQGTGSGPGNLHRVGGADASFDPHAYYQHSRDRMYSGLTVVAWQLVDVPEGAGGLCATAAFARILVPSLMTAHLPSQGRDPRHAQGQPAVSAVDGALRALPGACEASRVQEGRRKSTPALLFLRVSDHPTCRR